MHTIISQAEYERPPKSQNAKVEAQASEWLYLLAEVPETVAQSPKHNFSLFAVILAKFSWKYSFSVSDFQHLSFSKELVTLRESFDLNNGFRHLTDRFKFNHGGHRVHRG